MFHMSHLSRFIYTMLSSAEQRFQVYSTGDDLLQQRIASLKMIIKNGEWYFPKKLNEEIIPQETFFKLIFKNGELHPLVLLSNCNRNQLNLISVVPKCFVTLPQVIVYYVGK